MEKLSPGNDITLIKLISRINFGNKFSRMWHADLVIVCEDPIVELSAIQRTMFGQCLIQVLGDFHFILVLFNFGV